jgi:glycolate oxidase FAD binding subunit
MVSTPSRHWSDLAADSPLTIDGEAARFVARPSTPEELADTLRQATDEGLAVAPRGGGTRLGLGNPPSRLDLILDTTGLAEIVEYEPADLTVTVRAGMRFADLQRTLAEQGQVLALDPPALPESTIGGIIAANASGPCRYAYGSARDLVIGTRLANADGKLTRAGGRVVKNVAGYDLNKLYVGSLGTLGVIVELSFKLAPIPPAHGLVVASLANQTSVGGLLAAVVHSPIGPMAIEVLGPGAARAAGLDAADTVIFRLGGYPAAVDRQRRELMALVLDRDGRIVELERDVWDEVTGMHTAASQRDVVVKGSAPIGQTSAAVEVLQRELAEYEPLVWARGGNGIAYAALDAPADGVELASTLRRARTRVATLGDNASLVVERCPTAVKRGLDVWGDPGSGVQLMRALKQQLDPRGTLNPGRYVAGI